jgi:Flp pilus assembly protein TadB
MSDYERRQRENFARQQRESWAQQQAQREQANKRQFERNMEQVRQQGLQRKEQDTRREEREAALGQTLEREQRQRREQKEQAKQQAGGGVQGTKFNIPSQTSARKKNGARWFWIIVGLIVFTSIYQSNGVASGAAFIWSVITVFAITIFLAARKRRSQR